MLNPKSFNAGHQAVHKQERCPAFRLRSIHRDATRCDQLLTLFKEEVEFLMEEKESVENDVDDEEIDDEVESDEENEHEAVSSKEEGDQRAAAALSSPLVQCYANLRCGAWYLPQCSTHRGGKGLMQASAASVFGGDGSGSDEEDEEEEDDQDKNGGSSSPSSSVATDTTTSSSTTYFKSSDGHYNKWSFSTARLNLHLIESNIVDLDDDMKKESMRKNQSHHPRPPLGVVLVDATQHGKRFPDSFAKTIPIWCQTLNAALGVIGQEQENDEVHDNREESGEEKPPLVSTLDAFPVGQGIISKYEAWSIEKKIPEFVARFRKTNGVLLPLQRYKLRKPLKCHWVAGNDRDAEEQLEDIADVMVNGSGGGTDEDEFFHIVLLSASGDVGRGTSTSKKKNRKGKSAAASATNKFFADGDDQNSDDEEDEEDGDDDDYFCRIPATAAGREGWSYVPGAADDHQSWSRGLDCDLFWRHAASLACDKLASPSEIESRIDAIVRNNMSPEEIQALEAKLEMMHRVAAACSHSSNESSKHGSPGGAALLSPVATDSAAAVIVGKSTMASEGLRQEHDTTIAVIGERCFEASAKVKMMFMSSEKALVAAANHSHKVLFGTDQTKHEEAHGSHRHQHQRHTNVSDLVAAYSNLIVIDVESVEGKQKKKGDGAPTAAVEKHVDPTTIAAEEDKDHHNGRHVQLRIDRGNKHGIERELHKPLNAINGGLLVQQQEEREDQHEMMTTTATTTVKDSISCSSPPQPLLTIVFVGADWTLLSVLATATIGLFCADDVVQTETPGGKQKQMMMMKQQPQQHQDAQPRVLSRSLRPFGNEWKDDDTHTSTLGAAIASRCVNKQLLQQAQQIVVNSPQLGGVFPSRSDMKQVNRFFMTCDALGHNSYGE